MARSLPLLLRLRLAEAQSVSGRRPTASCDQGELSRSPPSDEDRLPVRRHSSAVDTAEHPAPGTHGPARWSLRLLLLAVVGRWLALGLSIAVVPGITAGAEWDVLLAALVLAVLGGVLRPVLAAATVLLGWAGVVVGWLLSQAVLLYLAVLVTPGIHADGLWPVFWASWIFAIVGTAIDWLLTAGESRTLAMQLRRNNRRVRGGDAGAEPGVVLIQIDGLSAPLLRWAVAAGNLPTLSRWLRTGSHELHDWHAQLPATTPASQAGLLHGASEQIPAFRWYEKESGRLVVTNHPKDSALVEQRLTNGRGLLAGGGVSLSNVFSGDAAVAALTMSRVGEGGRRNSPSRSLGGYLIDPYGFTRALVLTVGEMVKEVYQARRQQARGIEPRVPRDWSYVALRGLTNVLLRELNVNLIAEHMARGAPAIYCDFVDYDEVAHHAGPTRAESLASLEGIDRVLGVLEEVAATTARRYSFVVLSDHGQSQGATFRQRYGSGLDEVVRSLLAEPAVAHLASGADEVHGPVTALVQDLSAEPGLVGSVAGRSARKRAEPAPPSAPEAGDEKPELVVLASGNLGLVYLGRVPGRVTLEDLQERHPALLRGLTAHPGVGFVLVRSRIHGAVVLGADGTHHLRDGKVEGRDPLARFGPHAADDLRRHDGLAHAPDLLVNSRIDDGTDEVAAFEELVGCHGGLGGWQNQPVLVAPAGWTVEAPLIGADAVHFQLVRWLEQHGAREVVLPPGSVPVPASSASGDAGPGPSASAAAGGGRPAKGA